MSIKNTFILFLVRLSKKNMALKEMSKLKILGLKGVTKKVPSKFALTAFVTMQTAYQ